MVDEVINRHSLAWGILLVGVIYWYIVILWVVGWSWLLGSIAVAVFCYASWDITTQAAMRDPGWYHPSPNKNGVNDKPTTTRPAVPPRLQDY